MAPVLPLDGVAVQATDAVDRAEQLSDLRESYRSRLRGGSRAHEVVDLLFANPILTVRYVQGRLGLSQPGASNLLRLGEYEDIVQEVGTGARRAPPLARQRATRSA